MSHIPHDVIQLTSRDRETLRLHRLAARKTLQEIGNALGHSRRWVYRVEKGQSALFTLGDLMRLAKALDIHPDHLVSGR